MPKSGNPPSRLTVVFAVVVALLAAGGALVATSLAAGTQGNRPQIAQSGTATGPSGTTLFVTSSADDESGTLPGTLRNVVENAKPGDAIVINPGVDPVLTGGPITVGSPVSIQGQGPSTVVTDKSVGDGDGSGGIFDFEEVSPASISDLTLTGGVADNGDGAGFGGAVYAQGSTLTISDVTMNANQAHTDGGAVDVSNSHLTLSGDSVIGNSAGALGGGVYVDPDGSTASIVNSTFTGNQASDTTPAAGGGLRSQGTTTLIDDTFANNGPGGNIGATGTLTLQDTIISGGTSSSAATDCDVSHAKVVSDGGNLEATSSNQCGLSAAKGDLIGVNPLLGPLAANGGPTETMALQPGSPAIDAVPAGPCPESTDQRGLPRPGAGSAACDIGAFEVQQPASTATSVVCAPSPITVGQTAVCTATVTDAAGPPSGLVSFSSSGPGAFGGNATCMLAGSGASASCSVSFAPAASASGTQTISATYAGDATRLGSSGTVGLVIQTIQKTITTTSIKDGVSVGCSPGSVAPGGSVTCSAVVTPGASSATRAPSGSVVFSAVGGAGISGGGRCQLTAAAGATASCSVTYDLATSASGTVTVSASYAGDTTYLPGAGMTSFAVEAAAGKAASVTVLSGTVLIRLPGQGAFVPLVAGSRAATPGPYVPLKGSTVSVPVGSSVDTRKGTVALSSAGDYRKPADRRHRLQNATLSAAIFTIRQRTAAQARARLHKRERLVGIPSTDLLLQTPAGQTRKARCRRTGRGGTGLVRRISGFGKGLFRTFGVDSVTTIRNATWVVEDRCNGTLTEVGKGSATVTPTGHADRHQKTVTVHHGQGVIIKGRFL